MTHVGALSPVLRAIHTTVLADHAVILQDPAGGLQDLRVARLKEARDVRPLITECPCPSVIPMSGQFENRDGVPAPADVSITTTAVVGRPTSIDKMMPVNITIRRCWRR